MKVFPAIDIRKGQVVSLEQGDFSREEAYSNSPLTVAEGFKKSGAEYLHMVDLDGAQSGTVVNHKAVEDIIKQTGMFVQIGGGIRDEQRICDYLDMGISRVILGSIAAEDTGFAKKMIEKYKEKIAIAVDAKKDKVAVHGWEKYLELSATEFCALLDDFGADTIIYTDIEKDGMLGGSNLEVYEDLVKSCKNAKIIASGGISTLEEIESLNNTGVDGIILGKAIYISKLNLSEVIALVG